MKTAARRWLAYGFLLAGVAGTLPAWSAQLNNATATGTIGVNGASTKPYPSLLTTTYTVTGASYQIIANNGPLTTLGGATAAMFTPNVPTATTGIQLQADGAGCSFANNAATSTTCTRGTLQIAFSRPVTNPIVHFVGLGSVRSITGDTVTITAGRAVHTIASSVPAGATMTLLPGAVNLQTLAGGTSLDLINTNYNGTNCSAITAPATQLAGCGSVRINGTVSSVTFNVSMSGTRNVFNATIGNDVGSEGYMVTTTVDEDFGDAPASYDAVEAASHIVDGIRLGASVDAENTNTFNQLATPTTPSPNAVAAGADNNGAAGDGADEDGLTTPLATLHTGLIGQAYTLTPSLSGVTAAGSVCGWIDFNRNGVFETAERTCTAVASGDTSVGLSWTVPVATTAGRSYVRLRASHDTAGVQNPTGRIDSGEVEDYMIEIKPAIRVIKQLSPTSDTGRFDLGIGGTAFALAAGHNGTTNFRTLYHNSASGAPDLTVAQNIATTAITTTVTEVPTPATTGVYTNTYSCVNGSGATIATGTGTSVNITLPVSVTGAAANGRAQAVTCTFTNTAVLTGTIVIAENAVPDSAQDFGFTTTGTGLSGFNLDDDADPALPNTRTFSGLTAGAYTVTQTAPPANWPLTALSCVDPDGGTTVTPASRLSSIDLDPGETVTCTYTNSLLAMTVAKSTTATSINAPGSIPYTIVVTNTGAAPLTGVAVNDTLPGGGAGTVTLVSGDTNGNNVLDPGEAWTYTTSYNATQANIDAGTALVNNVSVTTTQIATPVTSSATTTIVRTPAMTVSKTTPTTSVNAPGTINYSIVVANTGNVSLTGVTPVDTLPGGGAGTLTLVSGDSNTNNVLDVGETWTYSASYTVTQANIDAGTSLVNSVSVTTAQIPTPVTSSATTTVTRTPAMTVNKTTPTTSISAPGVINYSIVVRNTGNVTLTGVAPVDTLPNGSNGTVTLVSGDTDGDGQLDVGETWTYSASYTATQANINAGTALVNNVSVTTTQIPTPVTSSATTTITQSAAMTVAKSTTTTTIAAPGTINYTIVVTNTGNVALTGVTPVDTLPGGANGTVTLVSGDTNTNNVLDIGEAWTYSASYAATQANINAGTALVNNVSVTTTQITTPVTSSATTTIVRTPAMTVNKTTPTTSINAPGTINYSIVVANTGNVSLTGVTPVDTLPGGANGTVTLVSGDTNANNVLDVGETWTYSASYVATQANINAGTALVNNVSVTTTQIATPVTSSATTTIVRTPAMTVNKTTPTTSINAPGTINYSIVVANTGNVSLTGVTPVDTLPGGANGTVTLVSGDTNANNVLDVGETWTYSASYVATQANINAGTALVNNVSVTTTQITTPVTSSATTTIVRTPAMTVAKTTPTNNISTPATISYSIVVRNTGNVTLTGVTPVDTLPNGTNGTVTLVSGDTNANNALDVAETWTYSASYSATQADIKLGTALVNNVSVTSAQTPVPVSSSATTTISQGPALSVQKTTPTTSISAPGTISYSIVVRNTGNIALNAVTPVDTLPNGANGTVTLVSGDTDGDGALDTTETWTYSASYAATQANIDAGANLVNSVSVTSTQTPAPVTSSATTTITRTPAMTVNKTTPTTSINAPGTIGYSIVVANTGNVTLTGIVPIDTLPSGANGVLTLVSGDTDGDGQLDVGESWTYSASYTATQANINAGTSLVNTVSVTATQIPAPVTASATTTIVRTPAMTVNKTTPTTSIAAPGTINYSIVVANTGNVSLSGVTPLDTLPNGTAGTLTLVSGDINANNVLDVGETWTYAASYVVTQANIDAGTNLVNTVAVTTAQIPTPVGSSATTTVTRTPAMTVVKSTPTTTIGAPVTINYSIVVTNTGNVSLSGVTPVDTLPNGTNGTVSFVSGDGNANSVLDVGEAWTYSASYAATQADIKLGTALVNNVSVTSAQTPTPVSSSATTSITLGPALSVSKTTPTTSIAAPGTIGYSIVLSNTGNVALSALALVDTMPDGSIGTVTFVSGDSDGDNQLDVGETWTYSASYAATQADIKLGTPLVNRVSVTSTQTPTPVTASATTTISQGASMSVLKSTPTTSIGAPGTIGYSIVVSNTGNIALSAVTPVDTLPNGAVGTVTFVSGDSDGDNQLDIGETWTYSASYTATQANIDAGTTLVNTVSVTSTQTPVPVTSSASTSIVRTPGMTVSKTTPTSSIGAPGVIVYSIVVSNTGNVSLTGVTPADTLPNGTAAALTLVSGDTNSNGTLDVAEVWTYTTSYAVNQAAIDAGSSLVNTVSVTSTQTPAPVTASATTTVTRTPAMTVAKTTPTTTIGAPGTIGYSIVVTNSGNVSLSAIAPLDTLPNGSVATLTLVSGDANANNVLDVGEAWTYTTSYAASQADINAGQPLVNTVSVTSAQTPAPVTASATTTVTAGPALSVAKTTPTTSISAPGTIAYSIVVANTGNVSLTNIVPVDTMPNGSTGTVTLVSGDNNANNALDVGETWTYSASYAATQGDIDAGTALVNRVSVTSTQTPAPVTASATTTIAQGAAMTVSKTTPTGAIGVPTTIVYSIVVSNTGNVALTNVVPVDTMPDGSAGTVTFVSGDTNANNALDVGETWTYSASYAATQANIDAGTPLVNTVSVTSTQTPTPVTSSATTTITSGPAMTVSKTTLTTSIAAPGTIAYRIVVTNTGNVALTAIAPVDTLPDGSNGSLVLDSGDGNGNSVLDVGEAWIYSASYAVSQAAIDAGLNLVNTVSVTAAQIPAPVTSSATTAIAQAPALGVVKTTPVLSITAPTTIPYTIVVANTGNVTLTGLNLADLMPNGSAGLLTYVSGDADSDGQLDVGESWVYTTSFAAGPADIVAGGQLVNTVTVTSLQTASAVSATASTVIVGGPPLPVRPVPALGRFALLVLLAGLCGIAFAMRRRHYR